MIFKKDQVRAQSIVEEYIRTQSQNADLQNHHGKYHVADRPEQPFLKLFYAMKPVHILIPLLVLAIILAMFFLR